MRDHTLSILIILRLKLNTLVLHYVLLVHVYVLVHNVHKYSITVSVFITRRIMTHRIDAK